MTPEELAGIRERVDYRPRDTYTALLHLDQLRDDCVALSAEVERLGHPREVPVIDKAAFLDLLYLVLDENDRGLNPWGHCEPVSLMLRSLRNVIEEGQYSPAWVAEHGYVGEQAAHQDHDPGDEHQEETG